MQSIRLFFRRVFSGNTATGRTWMLVRPRRFIQPPKPSNSTSQVPNIHTSEISEKKIDPTDKNTWSQGPDLLWLHNTQDKKREMLKAKFEHNFPAMGTYTQHIDLPEGRVHIARYFP